MVNNLILLQYSTVLCLLHSIIFSTDKIDILERELSQTVLQIDLEADQSLELDPTLMQFMRLKCIEGADSFILEACFANTV